MWIRVVGAIPSPLLREEPVDAQIASDEIPTLNFSTDLETI